MASAEADRQPTAAQSRLRATLVVGEVALALLLVVGAALLIRTFVALRTVDPGSIRARCSPCGLSLADARFSTTVAVDCLVREGVRRVSALPGVVAAGATCCVPLENDLALRFAIDGRPLDGAYHGMAGWRIVSPGYFDVFRIPLVRGRRLTTDDRPDAPGTVVINQTMARQFWPTGDPIGQRLAIGRGVGPEFAEPAREIVSILVADVRDGNLRVPPRPIMYVPIAQVPDGVTALNNRFLPLAWIIRTESQATGLGPSVD